ncbi:hypothetical protein, partial [Frankia sp. CpI1-P]
MLDGSVAHPRAAVVGAVTGVVNGVTMIFSAAAIGWATDHLIVPAFA